MPETILFAFATGQMAAAVAAVLATIEIGEGPGALGDVEVVWLQDPHASREQWLDPAMGVFTSRQIKCGRVGIDSNLSLEGALATIGKYQQAGRFVFCAQGGRKLEALILNTALLTSGKPYVITYLQSRPIELHWIQTNADRNFEEHRYGPENWKGMSAEEIVGCSGYCVGAAAVGQRKLGDNLERDILKQVNSWMRKNHAIKDLVVEVKKDTNVLRPDGVSIGEWDVSIVLKDGSIIVLECKAMSNAKGVDEKVTTKDLQSRRFAMHEVGTTSARFWIVVQFSKSNAGNPQRLLSHIRTLDSQFGKGVGTPWLSFFTNDFENEVINKLKGRQDLQSQITPPIRKKLESFETQLDAIIAPYRRA